MFSKRHASNTKNISPFTADEISVNGLAAELWRILKSNKPCNGSAGRLKSTIVGAPEPTQQTLDVRGLFFPARFRTTMGNLAIGIRSNLSTFG